MGGVWARAGKLATAVMAAAPLSTARREMRGVWSIMDCLRSASFATSHPPSHESSAQEDTPHIGIPRKVGRAPAKTVSAVDENIPSMGEAQGLEGILLHHGDGHAVRVDGREGLEELLGGPRRQSCRRLRAGGARRPH